MLGPEDLEHSTGKHVITTEPLATGRWDENITWEFFLSQDLPNRDLCTAVCCILTCKSKLVLVRNHRGWEFPAGKIEEIESVEQAVIREIAEETGSSLKDPHYFGYKLLTATNRTKKEDGVSDYPFPHSFVVYYYGDVESFGDTPLSSDIFEARSVGYIRAQQLISPGRQYTNIVDHLVNKHQIQINQD